MDMYCSKCGGNMVLSDDECTSWCDTCGRINNEVTGFTMDGDISTCEKCGTKLIVNYDGEIVCNNCFSDIEDQDVNSYGIYLYDYIKKSNDSVVFPLKYKIVGNDANILYSNRKVGVIKNIKEFITDFRNVEECFYSHCKTGWNIQSTKLTIGVKEYMITIDDDINVDRYSFIAFIYNIYWNISDN